MIRHLLACFLTALLLVSAVGAGVARGVLPPADAITICADHGLVTIFVDERGEPVERQVLCPDCALAFHPATPGFVPLRWRAERPGRLVLPLPAAVSVLAPASVLPDVRAPPAAV
jgi:hypothetical protein